MATTRKEKPFHLIRSKRAKASKKDIRKACRTKAELKSKKENIPSNKQSKGQICMKMRATECWWTQFCKVSHRNTE